MDILQFWRNQYHDDLVIIEKLIKTVFWESFVINLSIISLLKLFKENKII